LILEIGDEISAPSVSQRAVKHDFVLELQSEVRPQEARYMQLERMAAESVELYKKEEEDLHRARNLLVKLSDAVCGDQRNDGSRPACRTIN
jgi:hypothetical protein